MFTFSKKHTLWKTTKITHLVTPSGQNNQQHPQSLPRWTCSITLGLMRILHSTPPINIKRIEALQPASYTDIMNLIGSFSLRCCFYLCISILGPQDYPTLLYLSTSTVDQSESLSQNHPFFLLLATLKNADKSQTASVFPFSTSGN